LLDAVSRINSVDQNICWTNVGDATANSVWQRSATGDVREIQAYCRTVRVVNNEDAALRFAVEWSRPDCGKDVEAVLSDEVPVALLHPNGDRLQVAVDLPPRAAQTLSLYYANKLPAASDFGLRRTVKAFVRRRLSEIRDNYVSRDPRVLAYARKLLYTFCR
jgi:hypothetical protein